MYPPSVPVGTCERWEVSSSLRHRLASWDAVVYSRPFMPFARDRRLNTSLSAGLLRLDRRFQGVSSRPRSRADGHVPGAPLLKCASHPADVDGPHRTGSTGPGRRFPRRRTSRISRPIRSGRTRSGSGRAGSRPTRARRRASASPTRSSIRRRRARRSRSARFLVLQTAGRSASRPKARQLRRMAASSAVSRPRSIEPLGLRSSSIFRPPTSMAAASTSPPSPSILVLRPASTRLSCCLVRSAPKRWTSHKLWRREGCGRGSSRSRAASTPIRGQGTRCRPMAVSCGGRGWPGRSAASAELASHRFAFVCAPLDTPRRSSHHLFSLFCVITMSQLPAFACIRNSSSSLQPGDRPSWPPLLAKPAALRTSRLSPERSERRSRGQKFRRRGRRGRPRAGGGRKEAGEERWTCSGARRFVAA